MIDAREGLPAAEPGTNVLAVIPSIGGPSFGAVVQLHRQLLSIQPISSVVVSNSHRLTEFLKDLSVPFTADGRNGGFGRSIRLGADTRADWDWLLIVNDDVTLDLDLFDVAVQNYLLGSSSSLEIVYFDEDKPRRIPHRVDVFLQVSLLGKAVGRIRKSPAESPSTYRSFSCVAISRDLYNLCNGFDEDLIFTYEDADFVARASRLGAVQRVAKMSGVTHLHSISSGKHVDVVLPVATYSAARYLDKLTGQPTLNSIIVLLALLLRLAFVPVTRASKKKHVLGIRRSIAAVIRRMNVRPELPKYLDL